MLIELGLILDAGHDPSGRHLLGRLGETEAGHARLHAAEREFVVFDVLGRAIDHPERAVVAGVQQVGFAHHAGDRLRRLRLAVEDERAAPGHADGGGMHRVAGQSRDAGCGLDQQPDAAGRVAGQVDHLDPVGQFVAVRYFLHRMRLDRRASPLRRGPIVHVRLRCVLPLPRVDRHRHAGEGVEILHVIPMRVGHQDHVDVGRGEAALGERFLQRDAAADMRGIDEDAAALRLDEDHGAEGGRAAVGAERVAGQEYIYGCHPRLLAVFRCRCRGLCAGGRAGGDAGLRRLVVADADRRLRIERAVEAELRADLADGGHHLGAEQLDAALGVLVADAAVVAPEREDAGPRFLEDHAQLGDAFVGRAGDDLHVLDLVLERDGARRRAPPVHHLDQRLAVARRGVAGRVAPDGVREAGELALHPHELGCVFERLLGRVGAVDAQQVAAVFGAGVVADFVRRIVVGLPDALGRLDRGVERDVGVAVLGRPDDGLAAEHAGDPDARVRLLHRQRPRVDHAVLVVLALPAEGAGPGPGLDDEVVRLFEALAVVGGVDAGGELLGAAAAHEAGDEPALRDHVDHGQLFGQPDRILGQRQRVAQQHDLDPLGRAGEDGGPDVALGLHAEGRVVVLVEHDPVDADLLRQLVLGQPLAVELGARLRVEVGVGEEQRGDPLLRRGLVVGRHRLLREVHQMHGVPPLPPQASAARAAR